MILFIIPPFYRFLGSSNNSINLGVSYVAAYLKSKGYRTLIYNADGGLRYADQNHLFDAAPVIERHPVFDEIREVIRSTQPEYVGLTMFTASHRTCSIIARIAKEVDPKIKVIIGGTHPTITATHGGDFDYVVEGEGEYQAADILGGRDYRKACIEDIDSLPYPARDNYINAVDGGFMITGRGCPYSCIFCASRKIWGGSVRLRSVGSVIDEAKSIRSDFISFSDETFSLVRSRTIEICRGLARIGKQWKCDTRADRIDRELAMLMKRSGCVRIKIGVESGSQRILDSIGKNLTKDRIRKSVDAIKKAKIPLTVYLMIGLPGETEDDIEETISFAKELDADWYSLSIATPYPGTKLHEIVRNGDQESWSSYYHQSRRMLERNGVSGEMFDKFLQINEGRKCLNS
jgi:radical SAM superfamily enzyme YgiQ (UPF0313 family)